MIADVRNEIKLIMKIPECHLIYEFWWLTLRITNTPLRQTAAIEFNPKIGVATRSDERKLLSS